MLVEGAEGEEAAGEPQGSAPRRGGRGDAGAGWARRGCGEARPGGETEGGGAEEARGREFRKEGKEQASDESSEPGRESGRAVGSRAPRAPSPCHTPRPPGPEGFAGGDTQRHAKRGRARLAHKDAGAHGRSGCSDRPRAAPRREPASAEPGAERAAAAAAGWRGTRVARVLRVTRARPQARAGVAAPAPNLASASPSAQPAGVPSFPRFRFFSRSPTPSRVQPRSPHLVKQSRGKCLPVQLGARSPTLNKK